MDEEGVFGVVGFWLNNDRCLSYQKKAMGLLYSILIGFVAGAAAKALTPQQEKGGWVSSIIICMVCGVVGGWLAGIIGISSNGLIMSLLTSIGGAFLVLFVYHKYLADKWNLPI